MISRGSNPSGEIREAALGSPEVWPCTTAKFKGTKQDKIRSTRQGLALTCLSMLSGPVGSAGTSDQQPPNKSQPLWDTEYLWSSGRASRKKSSALMAKTELRFSSRSVNAHLESHIQLSQLNPEPKIPCYRKVHAWIKLLQCEVM